MSSMSPPLDDFLKCRDINLTFRFINDYLSFFSIRLIFAVIYTVAITFGVIGNVMVILSVWKHRSLQSVRNIFIVSLSCSDIAYCLVSGTITPISAFYRNWFFGKQLCQLFPLVQGGLFCFSTFMLSAIFIDSFMHLPKRTILFNFLLAVPIVLPVCFVREITTINGYCGEFCIENWYSFYSYRSVYGTLFFMLQVFAPFLMMLFCYCLSCAGLRKGTSEVTENNEHELTHYAFLHVYHRSLRTTRMLKAMIGMLLCSRMTTVAFDFLRDRDKLPHFMLNQHFLFGIVAHCITICSTVLVPLLYILLNDHLSPSFLFHQTTKEFVFEPHT